MLSREPSEPGILPSFPLFIHILFSLIQILDQVYCRLIYMYLRISIISSKSIFQMMVSSINIQEHFVCTIYDLNDNKCDPHPFPRTTGSAGKYVPWRTYGRTCRWNRACQSPNPGETGWSECTSNKTQRGVCAAHCLQSSGAVY